MFKNTRSANILLLLFKYVFVRIVIASQSGIDVFV